MRVCGPQAVPVHGAARGRNAVEGLGSDASGRQAGQRQVSPNIQRVEWVSRSEATSKPNASTIRELDSLIRSLGLVARPVQSKKRGRNEIQSRFRLSAKF